MGEFQETATTEKEKYKDGCGCCGKYLFVDNKWVVVMVGNFRRGACCTGRAGTTK